MSKTKHHFSIAVTTDIVIFTILKRELAVLLIKRDAPPFKNLLTLPGGFVKEKETTHEAALRILKERAKIKDVYIEQLYTFDDPYRDPRGRIVSVTYFALVQPELPHKSHFFEVKKLPHLAFDHNKIIQYAAKRLRAKIEYTNVVYSLLPKKFTLNELRTIYEIIFGKKLDKRNFIKKFKTLSLLSPTKSFTAGSRQRPARLYTFKYQKPEELKKFF